MSGLSDLKQGARATWAAGNFDAIAQRVWVVGERCVQHAGVRAGKRCSTWPVAAATRLGGRLRRARG